MISTICLITSRLTGEARRDRYAPLLDQLRLEYPGALVVTVGDELYQPAGGDATPDARGAVPGADAEFVRTSVRVGGDEVPERYRRHAAAIQLRHVANARKHMDALREVARRGGVGLVLEDDAVIGNGWQALLRDAASHVARLDPASPGGCLGFLGVPAQQPGQPQQPGGGGARTGPSPLAESFEVSPVCDSYLAGPLAAACLSGGFLPVRFRTNVQISYLAESLGVNLVLFPTNAFCDGSKVGAYASTLNVNNRLLLNGEYMAARGLLESMQRMGTAGEKAAAARRAKEILTGSTIKSNSDMMFLRAVCEAELNGPRAGKIAFAAAYAAATRAGALINNESELLNSMIGLYGDVETQEDLPAPQPPAFSDPTRRRARPLSSPSLSLSPPCQT